MRSITLYLATKKGLEVLRAVIAKGYGQEVEVVIGHDSAVVKDYSEDIAALCGNNQIPVVTKASGGLSIAVSWRRLLDIQNLIVLHDSLLPKYRGFNPLVTALINGDTVIGVTAIWASERYDEGELVAQEEIEISYPITIAEAIDKISQCYTRLILGIFGAIRNDHPLPRIKQNEDKATYSLWRDEKDYEIDWTQDAARIKRFIDATGFPYAGATSSGHRVTAAVEVSDVDISIRDCGKIIFLDAQPTIVCGRGLLRVTCDPPIKKFRTRFGG